MLRGTTCRWDSQMKRFDLPLLPRTGSTLLMLTLGRTAYGKGSAG